MLKNYFKIALRNILKNKTSAAINVFGLTIGLTSCLLIALYIRHELSYDDFEQKGDRIARVIMEYSFDGSSQANKGNFTSVRVAPVFKRTFPEVESTVKMFKSGEGVVSYQDKLFSEKGILYADSGFFDLFSFKVLRGNPATALAASHQLLLTESTAKKYFDTENPLGKTLHFSGDSIPYEVTGILQDCPGNSQIKFDFLVSFSSLGITKEWEDTYWDANFTTYLLLKNKAALGSMQAKLPAFMKKEMAGQGATVNFYLEPFRWIHLHSEYAGFEPNNSITYIYILGAVALLILLIACSTYINLSTARSLERAREVGVRKVIGAARGQLFWQFIGESGLLCLLAILISLTAALLLMPYFNQLTDRHLSIWGILSLPFLGFSLLLVILISLAAGTYPALILSGFQPVKVLKGSFRNSGAGQYLRKSLIVFQFVISVFLIVATFSIQRQLSFIQHTKLGFDREHILVLNLSRSMLTRVQLLKDEFKAHPEILSVSRCVRSPVEGGGGYNMRSSIMPQNQQIAVTANPVDEDFVSTVGMQLIAGENFSTQDIKDVQQNKEGQKTYHFILNESAARILGWSPQEAIGKKMFMDDSRPGYVKGVVKDFHFESLHNPIRPFVLFPENWGGELLVKLSGKNLSQGLAFLESKWKALIPDRPFEYRFMDEDYNKLYASELRLGSILKLFAAIAIILACLGLFGLSSYSTQQRFKEIGVRKILGATVTDLVMTLSKDFIRLALVAIVIAFPIAWYAIHKWLEDFAYRTSISGETYLIAALLTLILAIGTVSIHALKAAWGNAARSLRAD